MPPLKTFIFENTLTKNVSIKIEAYNLSQAQTILECIVVLPYLFKLVD